MRSYGNFRKKLLFIFGFILAIPLYLIFTVNISSASTAGNCIRFDINCDGKTDIADFYALVFYLSSNGVKLPWQTNSPDGSSVSSVTLTPSPNPVMVAVKNISANNENIPDAPPCKNHDPNQWHALYDPVNKCHYDHEHGDDPSIADSIFGPVTYAGGPTINYPWDTSTAENNIKHPGYKFLVRTPGYNPLPDCHNWVDTYGPNPNCVVAARIQVHLIAATMDAMTRYHSYYEELKICAYPDFTKCGIFKMGGWADFGDLESPYPGPKIVRPGGTMDLGNGMIMSFPSDASWGDLPAKSGEPYIAVENTSHDNTQSFLEKYCMFSVNCDYMQGVWSMNDLDAEPHPQGDPPHNQYIRFLVRTFDDWNLLRLDDLYNPYFFCRDGSCDMNGSVRALNEVNARIPFAWDTDQNGFVSAKGYTDRWGNPLASGKCTNPGLDCVPYSLETVPVGIASTEDAGNGKDKRIEYDTSPTGVHWIKFPN